MVGIRRAHSAACCRARAAGVLCLRTDRTRVQWVLNHSTTRVEDLSDHRVQVNCVHTHTSWKMGSAGAGESEQVPGLGQTVYYGCNNVLRQTRESGGRSGHRGTPSALRHCSTERPHAAVKYVVIFLTTLAHAGTICTGRRWAGQPCRGSFDHAGSWQLSENRPGQQRYASMGINGSQLLQFTISSANKALLRPDQLRFCAATCCLGCCDRHPPAAARGRVPPIQRPHSLAGRRGLRRCP